MSNLSSYPTYSNTTGRLPYSHQPQERVQFIDPGNQSYINPTHIEQNQNYYTSPIIQNPPVGGGGMLGNQRYIGRGNMTNNQYQMSMVYGGNDPYYQYQYGGQSGYGGTNMEHGYNQYAGNYYGYPSANQNYSGQCAGCQGQAYSGYYGQSYGGCSGCNQYQYPASYNYGAKAGCGCGGGCGGCGGQSASHHHHGQQQAGKTDCGCGCGGAGNCGQYGLTFNRDRLTPKFPSKLGHSFVTSGAQVQNKLVINEPTVQSAPFQTQRRKTYQPYTRKYLQYQDYVNYVPVQRSQWNYKKVLKQIDFVPQQYYQTTLEYIPRQKIQQKIRYLPVQQQILHVPEQKMKRIDVNEVKQTNHYVSQVNQPLVNPSVYRPTLNTSIYQPNTSIVDKTTRRVINNSDISIHPSRVTWQEANIRGDNISNIIGNTQNTNIPPLNAVNSLIRPAQSTVQMVSNSQFQSFKQPVNTYDFNNDLANRSTYQQNIPQQQQYQYNESSFRFPQTGGIRIGSSSNTFQQQPQQSNSQSYNPALNSFGPCGDIQVKNQQVVKSIFDQYNQNKTIINQNEQSQSGYNYNRNTSSNFRQSGNIESEQYEYERPLYKKNSLVHRINDDEYN